MLFQTIAQAWVFAWMMAAGCVIGAWYACLAALRRLLSAGTWLSLAADLAFALGAAVIYVSALIAANHGQLRLYTVAATALGFTLFAVGVFPSAKRSIRTLLRMMGRIVVNISGHRWIKVIFK